MSWIWIRFMISCSTSCLWATPIFLLLSDFLLNLFTRDLFKLKSSLELSLVKVVLKALACSLFYETKLCIQNYHVSRADLLKDRAKSRFRDNRKYSFFLFFTSSVSLPLALLPFKGMTEPRLKIYGPVFFIFLYSHFQNSKTWNHLPKLSFLACRLETAISGTQASITL